MSLTETEELLESMRVLADKIDKDKPNSHPLVVCIEGTNRAFFNTK